MMVAKVLAEGKSIIARWCLKESGVQNCEPTNMKIAEYVRGWMNYCGISEYYRPIPEIDEWLRRRIRMCYWKQWRYARTKVRNLLKLGTSKRQAILKALSRKGPWHLARTLAAQTGMTNKWLYGQGLISVKEQWVKIHYPATVR